MNPSIVQLDFFSHSIPQKEEIVREFSKKSNLPFRYSLIKVYLCNDYSLIKNKEHEKDTTGQDQYERYQQDMHHDTRLGERPPEGRALPTHLR